MNTIQIISELLRERGVTASTMCKELGFSSGLFTQWKQGKQQPSITKIKAMSRYFGIPMSYLLGETSDPNDKSKTHWMEAIQNPTDDSAEERPAPKYGDGPSDPLYMRLLDLLEQATPEMKKAMLAVLEQMTRNK